MRLENFDNSFDKIRGVCEKCCRDRLTIENINFANATVPDTLKLGFELSMGSIVPPGPRFDTLSLHQGATTMKLSVQPSGTSNAKILHNGNITNIPDGD